MDSGTPLQITVHVHSKESDSTSGDTITVHVTSTTDPFGVDVELIENGDTGDFVGDNFVFLHGNYQFLATDTVTVTVQEDAGNVLCTDGVISTLSSIGGPGDGIFVYSDTEVLNANFGVGLLLTETGVDTCYFSAKLKFTTTGVSDETTGTLLVSPGDILTFLDDTNSETLDAQIIPSIPGKGSIQAAVGDTVTVEYGILTDSITLDDDFAGGRGGGGLVRPGLVIDAILGLLNFGGSSGSTEPATLGLDTNQKRIVDGGFSFNGNPVDVEQFYTPYPLITTPVGQNNTIKLKIYEDRGPDNIAHIGLSYGLGKGEIFNEGRAMIEYDRTFDGIESVTLFDPKHVLGSVNVTTTTVNCSILSKDMCLEVTFDHIFRESLDYNMVATNIWDFQRNSMQNYFNHGIQIVGESMNPPEEYSGIYQGHIYHLTETGQNTAIDDDGNNWTFDKVWNRDYIKPVNTDNNILNPNKIYAIEQLGFQHSDGKEIFGYDRADHRFTDIKNQQQIKAQNIMSSLCPECQKEHFEKINGIFSYDMSTSYSKLSDPQIITQMNVEDQKARQFLKEFFEKIYPQKVDD